MTDSGTGQSKKGCEQLLIILNNFIWLDMLKNKSNCYFWKCKFCKEAHSKHRAFIEHHDNNLLKHLINKSRCPQCPQTVHHDGYNVLHVKGGVNTSTVPLTDDKQSKKLSKPESPRDTPSSETSGEKQQCINTRLKQHFDQPMTETQLECVNIKLFH